MIAPTDASAGISGRKVRQAAPQPAPPVELEAKPIAPLGPETAGDRLMPPTQLEQQPQARTATEAGDAWPQAASPAPLPAAPIEAVAPSEPAVIAPPVAVERAAPQAQDTVADTVPQQIAVAAETTPSTAMGPALLLAVAALAIAGIFLAAVFKTARRQRVHVHRAPSWRSAAHEQTEPPYDSAIAPPLSPIEQTERHDEEGTVRNILRALQRRAA